ncbi:FHA domain-containing protein [Quisquiliibacterium transsilvanicum]|uniref:PSer/pThr/pTyr-binding forkhead associated (FHA) protein n=1 Tax=Quisquiliibacterium transsilvanicum TaxID=1549638 RepID=A0A7W8HK70_9BURK|nr:FHA domain-containing protein [Quisquiliibacterium transsilvanicum]MBB5273453.1 pSer/pThr/pTyr-binding forkhead associated (FHA) protein [Quisquiliibacterium transsilvanicum]
MQQHENTVTARLVLSFGDLVLRSFPVVKTHITIGRRPYNDIALDDLTVSGEHAVILSDSAGRIVKDLNSRNGTLVNGRAMQSHRLQHADLIEVGIYRLRYLVEHREPPAAAPDDAQAQASLEWLTGPQRGSAQPVDRPIVPIAGAGNQVAVVSRRRNGFFVTHLEGLAFPLVNGESIGLGSHPLSDGDLIELSGTMLRFRVRAGGPLDE